MFFASGFALGLLTGLFHRQLWALTLKAWDSGKQAWARYSAKDGAPPAA